MNGCFTRRLIETGLLSSSGQILSFSKSDEAVVDNTFLTCLTRLPDHDEKTHFSQTLAAPGNTPAQTDRQEQETRGNIARENVEPAAPKAGSRGSLLGPLQFIRILVEPLESDFPTFAV